MNPKFNSDSSAWESVRDTSLTEGHDTAALRDMSALRRVLHLVWEIACRYEIVWNSKQQSNAESRELLHGENRQRKNYESDTRACSRPEEAKFTACRTGRRSYFLDRKSVV